MLYSAPMTTNSKNNVCWDSRLIVTALGAAAVVVVAALAAAFCVTGIAGAGYGFLESAGLPHVDYGLWLWPFMAFVWGIATIVAMRRYR
jgi:hypothetical protein